MLKKLIKWIIVNQHPFTIVEEPNFVNFVHTLCPNAVIILADTVKRRIIDLYESNTSEIQKNFQDILGKISFTIDIWTSPSTKSFLSITAHYIDNDWKLRNVLIDFIQIFGKNFLIITSIFNFRNVFNFKF
jgi:hypothetical protein